MIVNTRFIFPSDTKYPSIPCYIDKTSTVYPLSGEAYLTGPEYLLATNQGCEFKIKSAFYIPAKTRKVEVTDTEGGFVSVKEIIKPFEGIFKYIQGKRREHAKGTLNNMLFKEVGNSIYGNVVRGISNKLSYDCHTGKTFRVGATELSNPILASWTTAFIRSVIGECLHNVHKLGGNVVSVTTDGFITDIESLESRINKLPLNERPLFKKYQELRGELTTDPNKPDSPSDPTALELKSTSIGVIS